jgi:chromate transporter
VAADLSDSTSDLSARVRQLALLFLKLGATAFGGPAAHIGMMHDEIVKRRHWLEDQEFLDMLGATNLIPGPNSTEMAIHIGFRRAGWRGLITAGVSFIVPAMIMVTALAWSYAQFGSTPQAGWLLYGVKPVVIAIILQALWNLARRAIKSPFMLAIGLAVLILYFVGVNELLLLVIGGLAVMVVLNLRRLPRQLAAIAPAGPLALIHGGMLTTQAASAVSLTTLFFTLLKIGSVLYGSGYVLLAFLRADLVQRLGWLTDRQLLDAIAIGQVTPGPVFTTATFIGYILGGLPGAVIATVGIFLPSFVFVAISNPLIPRMRESAWVGGLLDGVNVASLGLMGAVTWQLGRASLIDPLTVVIALASFGLLVRFRLNSTWLIALGAIVGYLSSSMR